MYSTSSDSTNSTLWLEGVAPLEATYPTTDHSASRYESGQLRLCGEIDTWSPGTMPPEIALSRTISLEVAPSRTVSLGSVSTHSVPTSSSSLESIITSPGSNLPLHWTGSRLQSRSKQCSQWARPARSQDCGPQARPVKAPEINKCAGQAYTFEAWQ